MIDLFHLAPNDQSVYYLGRIFGIVGTVIPPEAFPPGDNPPIILSELFKVLNGVALTVGVLIVTYTTVVGLFATAAEGEFLGKKWSGLWVPIRTIIGIAGLFPSSGGYCAIQVILMWIIIQGVSAADMIWTRALEVINVVGNPTSGVGTADSMSIETQMQGIFKGLVCQETARLNYAPITRKAGKVLGTDKFTFYCYDPKTADNRKNNNFCKSNANLYDFYKGDQIYRSNDVNYIQYNFGPGGDKNNPGSCGRLLYENSDIACQNASDPNDIKYLQCLSARAQATTLPDIINTILTPIAAKYAQTDYQFIQFYEAVNPDGSGVPATQNSYISQFCLAPNSPNASPQGLGLTDNTQCCANIGCAAWDAFFKDYSDIYGKTGDGQYSPDAMANTNEIVIAQLYRPFAIDPTTGKSNFIKTAAAQYANEVINKPMSDYMSKKPKQGWIVEATNTGWLLAGGYYMQIAKQDRSTTAAANPKLEYYPPSNTANMQPMEQTQRNNLISADSLVQIIGNQNRAPSAAVTFEQAGVETANAGYYQMQGVLNIFMENLTLSEDDPIYSIAKSGYKMMISAQLLFASFAVSAAITAAVSSVTSAVIFGNGVPQGPGLAALNMIFKFLGPLVLLLVSTLFTVGALLGVYVPLIPYIVFTVTSIGWFIGVIEAMVAAPFIALGIMSPGGQHELMSRAEPSIMILFNLFLRPTLMVIGMLAAMLLASAVVRIINSAFSQVMYQIISNPGLIEQIVFMCAYTILIITALSKCFSLIHMLPERTLTYIGGHAIQYGEEQALQAVKGGVEAASSAMMKGGRAAAIGGARAKGQPEGKEGKMKGSAENTPAQNPPSGTPEE